MNGTLIFGQKDFLLMFCTLFQEIFVDGTPLQQTLDYVIPQNSSKTTCLAIISICAQKRFSVIVLDPLVLVTNSQNSWQTQ